MDTTAIRTTTMRILEADEPFFFFGIKIPEAIVERPTKKHGAKDDPRTLSCYKASEHEASDNEWLEPTAMASVKKPIKLGNRTHF